MGKGPKPDLERKQKDINLKRIKHLALCIVHPSSAHCQTKKDLSQESSLYSFCVVFLTGCKLDQPWSPRYKWIHHPLIRMTARHTFPIPSLAQLFPCDWHLEGFPFIYSKSHNVKDTLHDMSKWQIGRHSHQTLEQYIFLALFTKGELKTQSIGRPPWDLAEWSIWGDWCCCCHLGAAMADQMCLTWESLFKIEKKKTYLLKGGRIVVSDFNPLRRKLSLKSFRIFLWIHNVQVLAQITAPLFYYKSFYHKIMSM